MSDRRISSYSYLAALLTGVMALANTAHAAQPMCKPALAVQDVQFSKWQLPSMARKWSAIVSVDASRCAANSSGYFDIGFSRAKENGYDLEFRQQFIWMTPSVKVGVDFWADEAVEKYWIENVTPCTCAQ
jgi:hypothetical protein